LIRLWVQAEKAGSLCKAVAGNELTIILENSEVFLDRIQTQEEIHRLIEEVFGERKRISLEEFSEIVEKVTSEMFLAVKDPYLILITYLIDRHSVTIFSPLQ